MNVLCAAYAKKYPDRFNSSNRSEDSSKSIPSSWPWSRGFSPYHLFQRVILSPLKFHEGMLERMKFVGVGVCLAVVVVCRWKSEELEGFGGGGLEPAGAVLGSRMTVGHQLNNHNIVFEQ
ncbi:hypothetical protein Tco_0992222 [Tanacetum coccineum]|uniref:Uncharacterized protein n=1 Tax=Tanacetum coccineum TaxID=301880 RepID=A0ABQ5F2A0_9ASTR